MTAAHPLYRYQVFVVDAPAQDRSPDGWWCFECQAESPEHAAEQALDDGSVELAGLVRRAPRVPAPQEHEAFWRALDVGSEAWWEDPDRRLSSGPGRVTHLPPSDERDEDSVIVFTPDNAPAVEVTVSELSPLVY